MKPATIVNIEEERKESRDRIILPFHHLRRERRRKMEEQKDGGGERSWLEGSGHWWWAMGSGAQIMWGVRCIRRGYAGDMRLMPLKAFGIASLFVGAIATTSVAFLSANGIHTVKDAIEMGANIRTNLGITPQIPEKHITEADDTS